MKHGSFKQNRDSWRRIKKSVTGDEQDAENEVGVCVPEERHKGSYDFDALVSDEIYKSKITQVGAVKRKYAVCFGYLGSDFQGLQINPGARSVEAELEKALFLAGGISEDNFGRMSKVQWTRAARTDRGVHAATQCCAMKLTFPASSIATFVEQTNSFLPQSIRVHTMTKVSKNFNSKINCSKRRYQYYMPTYCLWDCKHVNGLLAKAFEKQGPKVGAGYTGGYVSQTSELSLNHEHLGDVRKALSGFRIDDHTLTRFRTALGRYQGTKQYHNFTSDKLPSDSTAQRYIISFECSSPTVDVSDGTEWVLLTVIGQSFLLNQIRRMVGLAIDIARNAVPVDVMQRAFSDSKVQIPTAPAVSLYLGELFFDGYNRKQEKENQNELRLSKKRQARDAAAADELPVEESATKRVKCLTDEVLDKAVAGDNVTETSVGNPLPHDANLGRTFLVSASEAPPSAHVSKDGTEAAESPLPVHQLIDWTENSITRSAIQDFEHDVIQPHIVEQV